MKRLVGVMQAIDGGDDFDGRHVAHDRQLCVACRQGSNCAVFFMSSNDDGRNCHDRGGVVAIASAP